MPSLTEQLLSTAAPTPTAKAAVSTEGSLTEQLLNSSAPAAAVVKPASNIPRPDDPIYQQVATTPGYKGPAALERMNKGIRENTLGSAVADIGSRVIPAIVDDYKSGVGQATTGLQQVTSNQSAAGVGNIAMGALSSAVSPISGAAKAVIEEPVSKLTGNKEIGERTGMVLTSGLPIAGVIGKTAKTIMPTNRALDKLIDFIGPENLPDVIAHMKSNDRIALADAAPGVRTATQGLMAEPGPHQAVIENAVRKREATAKDFIEGQYDSTFGSTVDVKKQFDDMQAKARATGKTLIEPALSKAKEIDVTPVVRAIDATIGDSPVGAQALKAFKEGREYTGPSLSPLQNDLLQLRQDIRGTWNDREKMFLDGKGEQGAHEVQKRWRVAAQEMLDSQDPLQRRQGAVLMAMRDKLVDSIDRASGREYKKALGQYADDMHIKDAFEKGMQILSNRPTKYDLDRPEYWQAWAKQAKPDELEAVRKGARVAIDNQIRAARNAARKGTEIPEVDFNTQKLKAIFDPEEVDKLSKFMRDEQQIARTNSWLTANSKTASTLAGREATAIRKPVTVRDAAASALPIGLVEAASLYTTGTPFVGAAATIGAGLVGKGINVAGRNLDVKTNNLITKLSVATGNERDALIKALEARIPTSNPTKNSVLYLGTNALRGAIGP